ncbi:Spaetzle [Popillia japonica]|uniref:Spaetzle n=1 Tax=Popillia japonica TaxID=7064 RepID=A0AAW1I9K7_POPJA
MLSVFLIFIYVSKSTSYGYDSGPDQGACKRFRSTRMLQPPCDLALNTFCTTAGTMYPWHAVRRFVRENQGLMRRMYGDQQHISVLRRELESNDIESLSYYSDADDLYLNGDFKSRYAKDVEFDNELHQNDENTPRLLQDDGKIEDVLNTKFIYSEEPTKSIKLGDLRTVPQVRSTTQRIMETNTVVSTASTKTLEDNITEIFYEVYENQTVTENTTDKTTTATTTTTEPTTDTTISLEETTTEGLRKKETVETMLFQDVVAQKEKLHPSMSYKTQGVNACPVKQEVVAPFWANNTRGDVLALLNLYPYEQYVHWEKCTYEHRQMYCRDGCKCEQQYRLHRLLAYDPNNECKGIFADWFKFPSCCVCKCYDIPEFRVTSRSPRNKEDKYVPNWFKKKSKIFYN